MAALSGASHRRIMLLVFFLSGFSGLIYESIWTHYLKLFLGHAAYAQALVLVIFMGGLGIGSWLAARYSLRVRNLLLAYAVIEGCIGVLGILFHQTYLAAIDAVYHSIIPAIGNSVGIETFKWLLGAVLIFPQCILLGATFPLITTGLLRESSVDSGKILASLYFCNSLGGAIGILCSGFWLIRLVGLPGTIMTAGLLNIVLAMVVWLLVRKEPDRSRAVCLAKTSQSSMLSIGALAGLLLTVATFTGMSSFVYEVTWIRMLSLVLGSSTHAFELMLSAFILGLAIGGYVMRNRIDRLANPLEFLGIVQLCMGMAAAATIVFYNSCFEWMAFIMHGVNKTQQGYLFFNLASHAIALLVMLPATIFAGMTLPLLTHILFARGYGEKSVGYIYAANTVGSIAGVMISVHVLMGWLGLKMLLVVGAGIDVLLAILLFTHAPRPASGNFQRIITCGIALLVLVAAGTLVEFNLKYMSSGIYRYGELTENNVIFHRDGKTASVDVVSDFNDSVRLILTNGKPDAAVMLTRDFEPTLDEYTMALLPLIAMAVHPDMRDVAVIGMGSGVSSSLVLLNPGVESLHTIEIESAMVEGAKLFKERSHPVFTDARSHIVIEDAKTFFTRQQEKYDFILSEPSNPWVSGVSGLFTVEFYQHAARHLTEHGLFAQWVQVYEMDNHSIATIFASLDQVFADYQVYVLDYGNILILASPVNKLTMPGDDIFSIPQIAQELAWIQVRSAKDMLYRYMGNREELMPLFTSFHAQLNSDYFPILDQNAARGRFIGAFADLFVQWRRVQFFLHEPAWLRNSSEVTDTPSFMLATWIKHARSMADMLLKHDLGQRLSLQESQLPVLNRYEPLAFMTGFPECETELSKWIEGGIWVTENVSAFIDAETAGHIWDRVSDQGCTKALPASAVWLKLFRAVGVRDFTATTEHALALLNSGQLHSAHRQQFLIFAALLGHVGDARFEPAYTLASRYYPYPDKMPSEVRLLFNLAESGLKRR